MPEVVDFYASERQYADHLLPIWFELGEEERGSFFYQGGIEGHLSRAGVEGWAIERGRPRGAPRLTVVASFNDLLGSRSRAYALVNHGVGQTYKGDPRAARHPSYSGGDQREDVVLFLCPSERDAIANRLRYPDAWAEVVGCPKLDRWHPDFAPAEQGVVAVSFHFPLRLCPETMWAFPEYSDAVLELASQQKVIGHAHPRAWDRLAPWYEEHGIEPVEHFSEVLDRASCYVVDNSSTLFEFASTDRPVVVMNASYYRREVDHGLRFWEYADVGVQVDTPDDLVAAVELALEDPSDAQDVRMRITADLYGFRDGRCAERAAEAIRISAADPATRRTRAVTDPHRARRHKPQAERTGAELPLRRMIRAGATTSQLVGAQQSWSAMSPEERDTESGRLAGMSDNDLRTMLEQDQEDRTAVLGVTGGHD